MHRGGGRPRVGARAAPPAHVDGPTGRAVGGLDGRACGVPLPRRVHLRVATAERRARRGSRARRSGRRRRRRCGRPAWRSTRRWAMMIAVRPSSTRVEARLDLASPTCRSRFDVASSSTSTRGRARKARASARSWRSPDDSDDAALVHRRVDALRAAARSGRRGRRGRTASHDLVVGGVGPGEGDVVAERAGEQERLLRARRRAGGAATRA